MFRFPSALALVGLTALVLTQSLAPSASASSADWPQRGGDIPGAALDSEAGRSVALNDAGTIVAVGSWEVSSTGPGSVRVYDLVAGAWTQKGLTLTGGSTGDYFGHSIALSADGLTLAIGAPFANSNQGQVKVYTWTGSAWANRGTTLVGPLSSDFGFAVSLSDEGTTLAIGSPRVSGTTGALRVYAWDSGTSNWVLQGSAIAGQSFSEAFGSAVDLNGDGTVVVVGAKGTSDANATPGKTRVYAWSGSAWVQRGTDIAGDSNNDLFGYSVAISDDGTIIAAGDPERDGASSHVGQVRVSQWGGSSWVTLGGDIAGDSTGGQLGYSLDLSSDGLTLSAGMPKSGSSRGEVWVLSYSGGTWTTSLRQTGQDAEEFGVSVALAGNGQTFIAGGPLSDTIAINAGIARVYAYTVSTSTSTTESAGLPGVYLHVAGPVGRHAQGSPVYFGSDRVAITSTYLLTLRNIASTATGRVLASGVVDTRGNLEGRAFLPALEPGTYDVIFQGKHRGGSGLRLTARLTVGSAGQITVLAENVPSVWSN